MGVHVHVPTGSVLLHVEDPFAIRGLIPRSYTIEHPTYNVVCQHTAETALVLRNLGHNVPSPALLAYKWPGKYKPMVHQRAMTEFHITHLRGFNLSEMGTGKTAPALWAADILMIEGTVIRAAIIAPLSTLERTWQQDIFDVLMHRTSVVVHGGREKREKALAALVDFYVINHDGVALADVMEVIRKRKDINLVIVDEGSMFRNAKTRKYESLRNMLRPDQRVWWLTGTPCPNAPTDAWAQARIINPRGVPQFFGTFKRQTMTQITQFKFVARTGASQTAFAALQPAVRFMKKDCLDLPPVTTITLQAPLSPEQQKVFKAMKAFMSAEARQGHQITAVNAADKIGKLRQILCGAIKDPRLTNGAYITIPHAPRLEVLREAVDGASAKVLVIVPFKGITQALERELGKVYSVGVLNGDVGIGQRNRIISDFKSGADPHLLLCHPKVMAHGLNLTEADTLIFYAPIYSNDEFQQVVERFNRPGQTRKMTIIKIGTHALEWEIYRTVDARRVSQESILKLYKSIIE